MKHFGDITKLDGYSLPPVDIITGGSPCQDLSVAGKRAGMAGERSGLFMEQIRIIKEMREYDRRSGRAGNLVRPRYMVWENVPGAFSSNKGEDFCAVLEETARIADEDAVIPGPPNGKWPPAGCIVADGWSIAWRVHDAKDWGVPQRRKRVCLLADFNGDSAGRILFELRGKTIDGEPDKIVANSSGESRPEVQSVSNSLPRNLAESGAERQATAACSKGCSGEAGAKVISHAYGISPFASNAMLSANPNSGIYEADTARTLDLNGGSPACHQGGMAIVQETRPVGTGFSNECHAVFDARGNGSGEISPTITGDHENRITDYTAVVYDASRRHNYEPFGDVCETVQANYGTGGNNTPIVLEGNGSRDSHRGDGYSESETMYTLNTVEHHGVCYPAKTFRKTGHPRSSEEGQGWEESSASDTLNVFDNSENRTPTLVVSKESERKSYQDVTGALCASGYDKQGVQEAANDMYVVQPVATAVDCRNGVEDSAVNASLQSSAGHNINSNNVCRQGSVVRRLTPLECERLQSFPDNWTNIGDWVDSKGKPHKGEADSPRYKALGNSIALPFWQWMADRMLKYIDHPATMASLFDGIGGFPLVFSRCGCTPVWASEIEEFPIAVTKIHFPEKE